MEKLTKRQSDILEVIKRFMANHGYPPTVREIGKELDLSSPATTHFHLNRLEDKGYIRKNESKNRAMELLVENEYQLNSNGIATIPLVGTITAGNPIEAIENPDEFFSVPSSILSKGKEVFALLVKGESMINKGIHDKDVVIIERINNANNGDVVAAMTSENEVTLKTFYKEKNHIRLQPENDTMEPLIFNNITILGKAVGLYRQI